MPTSERPARPAPQDGRHLDPGLAGLRGEAAGQEAHPSEAQEARPPTAPQEVGARGDSYYELPVVKSAPWRWYVPVYFHVGGVAGAAATLAGAVQWARPRDPLLRRLHWIATLGEAGGAALLVADLGRPGRFHHMMRVFRPTSPMNMGTWILSAAGASGAAALAEGLWARPRRLSLAGATSALAGAMLATYTGVLVGNTAVPLWEATRRRVPLWFAASSAAGLGALLELVGPPAPGLRPYTVVAKATELLGAQAVEGAARRAGVERPLREGRAGTMWRGAKWLGAAGLAATLLARGRRGRLVAGALGTAATLLSRFALVEAGRASADDPHATFGPQRAARAGAG